MGKKLYEGTEEGGIRFKSERKPWEVRVPNYVYDLWMPVLGLVALGLYSVYCRLERENIVKAITLDDIARAGRIGKTRLYAENEKLEECGFVRIVSPEGWKRLAHHTTEITVLDPPQEVPAWAIEKHVQIKGGYRPLSPWLVGKSQVEPSDVPNGTSESPNQDVDEDPNGTSNVETLGLKPLGVDALVVEEELEEKPMDYLQHCAEVHQNRQREGAWTVPAEAGGDDAAAMAGLTALYEVRKSEPPRQGSGRWVQELEIVSQVLKDQGVTDPDVARRGAERFAKIKPDLAVPQYPSFEGNLGFHLGVVKKQQQRAEEWQQYEPVYMPTPELERPPESKDELIWRRVLDQLACSMQTPTFNRYAAPTRLVSRDDSTVIISAPDEFVAAWLSNRLTQTVEHILVGVLGHHVSVRFVLRRTEG